jgi:hypothetical protein
MWCYHVVESHLSFPLGRGGRKRRGEKWRGGKEGERKGRKEREERGKEGMDVPPEMFLKLAPAPNPMVLVCYAHSLTPIICRRP